MRSPTFRIAGMAMHHKFELGDRVVGTINRHFAGRHGVVVRDLGRRQYLVAFDEQGEELVDTGWLVKERRLAQRLA